MKNKPDYSNYETDIEKVFTMSNITQDVLNGTITMTGSEKDTSYRLSWSCLTNETKIQKVITYCNDLKSNEKNVNRIKSELIYLISKKKLNRNEHVEYDVETQKIINIPCVMYDSESNTYYMEIINNKVSLKSSILSNNAYKVS
jgi:hypothetical protein